MANWLYKKIGEFLKDAVYAANDGIITTFAIVAGVVGASLEPVVILVLGFANLIADGLSMASGNYLGTRSEQDLYGKERNKHAKSLANNRDAFKAHISKFLGKKGYGDDTLGDLSDLIVRNEKFALDFVMHEEMGLAEQESARPMKGAIVTLVAFVIVGLIPIMPYVFISNADSAFLFASIFTGIALFAVGAVRSIYMERSWISTGLEMLILGGLVASVSYGIGYWIKQLIVAAVS